MQESNAEKRPVPRSVGKRVAERPTVALLPRTRYLLALLRQGSPASDPGLAVSGDLAIKDCQSRGLLLVSDPMSYAHAAFALTCLTAATLM